MRKLSYLVLLTLLGCGSSEPSTGNDVCASMTLIERGTLTLSPAPTSDNWEAIKDTAFDGSELALLVSNDDGGAGTSYELWRYNTSTGARTGRETLDPQEGCELTSLSFDAAKTPLLLANCGGFGSTEWRVYALEGSVLVQRHSLKGPEFVQLMAYDRSGGRLCLLADGAISQAPASTVELAPVQVAEAPNWGPSSGFDCQGDTEFLARDAFEGAMNNKLLVRGIQSACTLDIEEVAWLAGQSQLRLAAIDARAVWVVTPAGVAIHLSWTGPAKPDSSK